MSARLERFPSFQGNDGGGGDGPRDPRNRDSVLELVRVRKFFTPAQVRQMLGGISLSVYYRITRAGHLQFSRMVENGPRIHTPVQIEAYMDYLDSHPAIEAPRQTFPTRVNRRVFK